MGSRVVALHSLLANHHAPIGFEATRDRLMTHVGVGRSAKWTETQLLASLALLEESRETHLAYRRAFASRRRSEKALGWRQPTRTDLTALSHPEWKKDAEAAKTRGTSARELPRLSAVLSEMKRRYPRGVVSR